MNATGKREGLPRFTSVGCYPLFYLVKDEALCATCATKAKASEEQGHINHENPALICDGCEKRIESAYAEDQAMARYTVQLFTDSGSWSHPESTNVKYARSKAIANALLADWKQEVSKFDDAPCYARVWIGSYDNVEELYPDYEITIGPRGGSVWSPC